MKDLAVWELVLKSLRADQKVTLLVVLQSEGSSPGRQGFKMGISETGQMAGSVGGGIMEHKLVELARNLMQSSQTQPVLKRQIHSKAAPQNQSGMICSGEQTIAIYFPETILVPVFEKVIAALTNQKTGILTLTEKEITFQENLDQFLHYTFLTQNDESWQFTEKVPARKATYIVGAGHVAFALSRVLRMLDFDLHLFDDRLNLNTFTENPFAHFKTIINYKEVADLIPEGPESFVVIMTFGYRTDKEVIKHLLGKEFGYIGLLGSKAKIEQLFGELKEEGFSEADLLKVHAPIGLHIKSKTPEEIAISIAAEIIQVKNR